MPHWKRAAAALSGNYIQQCFQDIRLHADAFAVVFPSESTGTDVLMSTVRLFQGSKDEDHVWPKDACSRVDTQ